METVVFDKFSACCNVDNDKQDTDCFKEATQVCNNCKLVQYCSRECQITHWPLHKSSCKSTLSKDTWKPIWKTEARGPSLRDHEAEDSEEKRLLWGPTPAIDTICLEENEGLEFADDLNLLFAASGYDLRNIVTSVIRLPQSYKGRCKIYINDEEDINAARNAIMLLLAFSLDPDQAWEPILHVWYSALIPESVYNSLQQKVLPRIEGVLNKMTQEPPEVSWPATWTRGASRLTITMTKKQWHALLDLCTVPSELSATRATEIRASVALSTSPETRDFRDQKLCRVAMETRLCRNKFDEEGLLLPFGASRRRFNTPNPTMFRGEDSWPFSTASEPLDSWPSQDVMQEQVRAKNDIYGRLHDLIAKNLRRFCNALSDRSIHIHLYQMNAQRLPLVLSRFKFDRVYVDSLIDPQRLGTAETLKLGSRLLILSFVNPHATLISIYTTVIQAMISRDQNKIVPGLEISDQQMARMSRLFHNLAGRYDKLGKEAVGTIACISLIRDFEPVFEKFMAEEGFKTTTVSGKLKAKGNNTIVDPWPMQVGPEATRAQFDLRMVISRVAYDRYVEWRRNRYRSVR